jgi:hypothetical protein
MGKTQSVSRVNLPFDRLANLAFPVRPAHRAANLVALLQQLHNAMQRDKSGRTGDQN